MFENICSPPARSPIMVAKEIGLELELKWVINSVLCACPSFGFLWREIDFINSEHMSESFTKVREKGAQNVERQSLLKLIQLTDQSGSNHSDFGRWRRCYLWQVGRKRRVNQQRTQHQPALRIFIALESACLGRRSLHPVLLSFQSCHQSLLDWKVCPRWLSIPETWFSLAYCYKWSAVFWRRLPFSSWLEPFRKHLAEFFDESWHNELLFSCPYWCRGSLRFRRTSPKPFTVAIECWKNISRKLRFWPPTPWRSPICAFSRGWSQSRRS